MLMGLRQSWYVLGTEYRKIFTVRAWGKMERSKLPNKINTRFVWVRAEEKGEPGSTYP